MIRRNLVDSTQSLLFPQVLHAQLAGELAGLVGNAAVAMPTPWAAVIAAIAHHDAGWPLHDESPTLDASGEPTDTFEMPIETVLAIWSESTALTRAIHPYAGLLVSLHGLHLAMHAADRHKQPGSGSHPNRDMFAINRFAHEQVAIQTELRQSLGLPTDQPLTFGLAPAGRDEREDLLRFNFQLLQWLDRLSLDLCYDRAQWCGATAVPLQPGGDPVKLRLTRMSEGLFTLQPWPFELPMVSVSIQGKRLARRFSDTEAFHQAWEAAAWETVPFSLRPNQD